MRSYLDAENTSRAAEFNTDCIRLVRWDGMPVSVALYSPTTVERETKPVTVERSAKLSDEYSAVDTESQNKQLKSLRRATSLTH